MKRDQPCLVGTFRDVEFLRLVLDALGGVVCVKVDPGAGGRVVSGTLLVQHGVILEPRVVLVRRVPSVQEYEAQYEPHSFY